MNGQIINVQYSILKYCLRLKILMLQLFTWILKVCYYSVGTRL